MKIFVALTLVFWSTVTLSNMPDYYSEGGDSDVRKSINNGVDEIIDPLGGALQLRYVDLKIPGPGGFDLNVIRRYQNLRGEPGVIGSDYLSPRGTVGLGWDIHFGRLWTPVQIFGSSPTGCRSLFNYVSSQNNPVLELPDGTQKLLTTADTGQGYAFITKDRWIAKCRGNTNPGLDVYSPEGVKYTFDLWQQVRGRNAYNVTRIEDRNGNWMQIDYMTPPGGSYATQTLIDQITTNDDRSVYFKYEDVTIGSIIYQRVKQIHDTWDGTCFICLPRRIVKYHYTSGPNGHDYLDWVELADGAKYNYEYYETSSYPTYPAGIYSIKSVTQPTGGITTYNYQLVCFEGCTNLKTTAVLHKNVQGRNATVGNWDYTFTLGAAGTDFDKTTIDTPDGTEEYWHYSVRSGTNNNVWRVGMLREKKIWDGNAGTSPLLQHEVFDWVNQVIAQQNEYNRRNNSVDTETRAPFLQTKTITRDGTDYTTTYSNPDVYGNPQAISETGNGAGSQQTKTTNYTYYFNPTKWIIHQPATETIPGVSSITRTFFSTGNLQEENINGVVTRYTYHNLTNSRGDIATITDPRLKVSTLSNYYRGQPRNESHPENVNILRDINYEGTIAWEMNGEGHRTDYTYDDRGRITSENPPGTRVATTTTAYTWASCVTGGTCLPPILDASSVITQGPYRETTTYDGFGNARVTTRQDTTRSISITSTAQHDALGRRTFQSYPGSGNGTTYTYDALGRVKSITQTGAPSKTFDYLPGNQVRITNERGKITTFAYRSFGDPDAKALTQIAAPEGVQVDIMRNSLDQIEDITIGGKTRDYIYNSMKYLSSIVDPETGTTVFGRDNNGNMLSRTVGGSGTTIYTYDDLNRLETIDYPGITPDVLNGYDRNGNLIHVSNSVASRDMGYGETDQKESESITLGSITYTIGFQYDNRDSLHSLTYPSGRQVTYTPDAFGRVTEVAPYASQVQHHDTGQLSQVTYANGYVTELTLDARNRLQRLHNPSGTSYVDRTYGYDGVGNITSITDALDPSYSLSMTYDDVDRLQTASGVWGAGTIAYSTTGNIDSKTIGSHSQTYHYGAVTHRLDSISGTQPYTFGYDDYGNITSDSIQTYVYDDVPSLRGITGPITVIYDYDGNNNRVREQKNGVTSHYIGTNEGQLLGVYDTLGNYQKEYIYLDNKQIAMVEPPPDADADGLNDDDEVIYGTDPNNPDSDNDGLQDGEEVHVYGTDPLLDDSDNDGFSDGLEVLSGSDPLDPGSVPAFVPGDITGDGTVNAPDLLLAMRQILGLTQLAPAQITRGDIYPIGTGDGLINLSDYILIQKQALQIP